MLNKVIEILDANSEETRHPQWGIVRLFTEDAILAAAEQVLTLLQSNDAGQPNGSKPTVSGALCEYCKDDKASVCCQDCLDEMINKAENTQ